MRKIPNFVLKNVGVRTSREFKQLKRKQVRDLEKSANELMRGLGCSPAGLDMMAARGRILIIKDKLSIKKWGR
jgi:hypothetical protein